MIDTRPELPALVLYDDAARARRDILKLMDALPSGQWNPYEPYIRISEEGL